MVLDIQTMVEVCISVGAKTLYHTKDIKSLVGVFFGGGLMHVACA